MIGIDLGATMIKGLSIDALGNVLQQVQNPTNDGNDMNWKQSVLDNVKQLLKNGNERVSSIGLSAPGLPNKDNTAIEFMPGRLQGLENFIWKDFLGHPTYVLNDAVAALMAEARFGSARNKKNVVMLTLGTGVGGAILIDGKPYQGAFHKAGHIGHMVINENGDPDVTGMPGSLEECVGDCTIFKRSGGKFESTQDLVDAFRGGNEFAKQVWLTSVKRLALGLASVSNILSPEIIVLGGGITGAGNELFEPLFEYMEKYEWRAGGNKAEIVKAKFGDQAGAIGAACFAMEKYNL